MSHKPEYTAPVAQLLTLGDVRPTMLAWPGLPCAGTHGRGDSRVRIHYLSY